MLLYPTSQPPNSRGYKPIYGVRQSISKTSSPLSARSSARYVVSLLALRYVPGQRKALSVRPPLRSRAAKRAFRSPSASLRLHYKHISPPFHFTPTSLQAHFAALPLHSDLAKKLLRSVRGVSPFPGGSPLLGFASPPAKGALCAPPFSFPGASSPALRAPLASLRSIGNVFDKRDRFTVNNT